VLEYMKRSETVIRKLLDVLMKNLNVTEIDETKESLLMGSKRTNLNYYPICPNPAELTVGVGRHSDVSTLTFLLQDDIGGLYVRGNNDSWIHVPPVSGPL
jgi:feruloyl-CoA ortho-hydroxylase